MANIPTSRMPNLDQMRTALRELGSSKRSVSRATFDALLPEIEQALKDDHPVKTIWASLHKQGLDVSLATFRKWLADRAPINEEIAQ